MNNVCSTGTQFKLQVSKINNVTLGTESDIMSECLWSSLCCHTSS